MRITIIVVGAILIFISLLFATMLDLRFMNRQKVEDWLIGLVLTLGTIGAALFAGGMIAK